MGLLSPSPHVTTKPPFCGWRLWLDGGGEIYILICLQIALISPNYARPARCPDGIRQASYFLSCQEQVSALY